MNVPADLLREAHRRLDEVVRAHRDRLRAELQRDLGLDDAALDKAMVRFDREHAAKVAEVHKSLEVIGRIALNFRDGGNAIH